MMIPKIIHYCWFGDNEKSEKVIKCISSWMKYCPDYKIIEWNEKNFDMHINPYVEEAYSVKKWAFVSDVARLYALIHYGGIYLDTDVELVKSPQGIINSGNVILGYESTDRLSTAFMACVKNHRLFNELLKEYEMLHFIRPDGSFDKTTNVVRLTSCCVRHGLTVNGLLQKIDDIIIYPSDYFSPKNLYTKKINLTENTIAIHNFDGSWNTDIDLYSAKIGRKLANVFPKKFAKCVGKFVAVLKFNGPVVAYKETIKWFKRN